MTAFNKQGIPRWRAIGDLISRLRKLIGLLVELLRLANAITA